jgi:hypothetical protein
MGYAVSWMAVKGKDKNSLLEKLGLKATGTIVEVEFEYNFAGFAAGEWYLLTMNEGGHSFVLDENLQGLSDGCMVWHVR